MTESGAQNVMVGDADGPTQLPETRVDPGVLKEERKMANYSQSEEFTRLRTFIEARGEFFRRHLPDGRRIQDVSKKERDEYWVASCVIVSEIENILGEYDQARKAVQEYDARQS